MAESKFEFLGNDRYFKYRYTNETPLNYATITETWSMENQVSRYEITADFLKRSFNIKAMYESQKFDYHEVLEVSTKPNLTNEAHCVMFPMPLSFFNGRQEYFSPSLTYATAKTIIVSAAPKRVLSTSLSFLNMDTQVVILTTIFVAILSILLVVHSAVIKKYKELSTKTIVKKLAKETLENVWNNASLLCSEPLSTVLPHITCRLLVSSWLIGVTFILFFLGCFLCTEFTTESFNCIDTLSDLIKSGIPPVMIEGSETFEYLQVLAAKDPVVQEWLDALDKESIFKTPMDYLSSDGYNPIISGKEALIITDIHLTWLLGEVLTSDAGTKQFFVDKGGLYLSQQEIGFDYFHIIYNASYSSSSPQIHEYCQLIMGPLFETQVYNYLDLEFHHPMEYVTWKRPLKSSTDLDLNSVIAPFYLFFMLMSVSLVIFFIEICLSKVA